MEVRTTKEDLVNAVRVVSSTTSQSSMDAPTFSGDLSSFYVFRKVGDAIEVFSYFGPLISKSRIVHSYLSGPDRCFAIESRRFNRWVSSISDGEVTITCGSSIKVESVNGSVSFPSVDTSNYPWWDAMLENSALVGSFESSRIDRALDFSKTFIMKEESKVKRNDLCSCEFAGTDPAMLYSTNQMAMSIILLKGFEKSSIRIQGKDIPNIRRFLSFCKGPVKVYEHDSAMFIESDDSVIGAMKSSVGLPKITAKDPYESAEAVVVFRKEDIIQAINILSSSTPDDNKKMSISIESADNIVVSMPSIIGNDLSLSIRCLGLTVKDGGSKYPKKFGLKYDYFLEVIRKMRGDVIDMAVKSVEKSGYISFKEDDGGDSFTALIGWDVK